MYRVLDHYVLAKRMYVMLSLYDKHYITNIELQLKGVFL